MAGKASRNTDLARLGDLQIVVLHQNSARVAEWIVLQFVMDRLRAPESMEDYCKWYIAVFLFLQTIYMGSL